MRPRHMSLCTGYGGIDIALENAFGAETVAVADVDKGACKILAHRYPNVPNIGDITVADWSAWAGRVDIISGGTPCQDLSHDGRRAGMTEGTRSNLWVAMREAIAIIRPALVVWENVRGAYSAEADSAVEPCPGCVGDPISGTPLRALGRVLGDLSELGYDSFWYGLRASDVGAAHHRFRVFIFAYLADAEIDHGWIVDRNRGVPAANLGEVAGASPDLVMPTPAVNDMGDGKTIDWWDNWTATMKSQHGNGNGHGRSLAIEAMRLMPSPRTSDTNGAGAHGDGGPDLRTVVTFLPTAMTTDAKGAGPADEARNSPQLRATDHFLPTIKASNNENRSSDWANGPNIGEAIRSLPTPQDWREYEPAIRRQEAVFGRPAPVPTEPGKNGKPRLSAKFSEWLMGCPDGWITDVPGITRSESLKAAGNGVVPQQCYAAAMQFSHDFREAIEAPYHQEKDTTA